MELYGLGGHRRFDPRNLDFGIIDHLKEQGTYDVALRRVVFGISRGGGLQEQWDLDDRSHKSQAIKAVAKSKAIKAVAEIPTFKYHYDLGFWGDQGNTPACTGFAAVHFLADGPVTQGKKGQAPIDPQEIYRLNQENDRKMGYSFAEGATSLAMAKTLKQLGYISSYFWGYDLNAVVQAALVSPVLIGIDWLEGMDDPDRKHGVIRAIGRIRGGHELLINGVDLDDGMFRLKNSWGQSWGKRGHAYLPFEDLEKLLGMGGEALLATEVKKP